MKVEFRVYILTQTSDPRLCLQFTKDVVRQLENFRIDLRTIILLEAEGKQNLLDFSEAGLSEINYADYLDEVTYTVIIETHEQEKSMLSVFGFE